jgi:hypothetical protein
MSTDHACLSTLRLCRLAAVVCIWLLSGLLVCSAKPSRLNADLGNDEETFIYAGSCFNGEPYRLFLYQKHIAGVPQSHYDYEGPVGTGTVQTEAAPKVMTARVCRKDAEIINAKYWE